MNNLRLFVCLVLVLLTKTSIAQKPSLEIDTLQLKLIITTIDGKPLKTKVMFENMETHKIKSCFTNAEGKANCVVPTESTYSITIPNSEDHYEYEVPEFVISPTELKFKFHVNPPGK